MCIGRSQRLPTHTEGKQCASSSFSLSLSWRSQPIAVPFANAASTDANGVVTVSKGDIQSAMGWNNAAWDTAINAPNGIANVGNLITTSHGTCRSTFRAAGSP